MIRRYQTSQIAEAVASPEKSLLRFCDEHTIVPYHSYHAEHPNKIGSIEVWVANSAMSAIMNGGVNIELTDNHRNVPVVRRYTYVEIWETLLYAPPARKLDPKSSYMTPQSTRLPSPLELWRIFGALYTWPQV